MVLTDQHKASTAEPRILRIVGDDRSGTTVIGTVLGQLPSAIFVGEAAQVWRAFTTPDWRCSCGDLVSRCPFWCEVRLLSKVDERFDIDALRVTTEKCLRVRPTQFINLARRSPNPIFVDYAEALEHIYRAIAVTAGSGLIVDSSKSAPELLLALRMFHLDLNILHMVRDPRAVAYSRSRKIPAMQPGSQWMASEGAIASSMRWTVRNALIEIILARYRSVQYRIRYEDLITESTRELSNLNALVDTTSVIAQLLENSGEIAVGPRHALDGNTRVLRQTSQIKLRLDDEWRSAMSLPKQLAAILPAFPLMLLYGYRRTTSVRRSDDY